MKSALEKLSVPVVLMGSLWAAVGVVLDAFKVINERRDLILELITKCGKCADRALTPLVVYWTNLFPLTTGLVLFLVVVTTIMIKIPRFVQLQDEVFERRMIISSRLLSLPLIFTCAAYLLGGAFDIYYLFVQGRI